MDNRDSIRQTLIQILQEDSTVPADGLSDSTCLRTDLNLDSVDFVGILMRIEGEYRIRLSHEELASITTVGDLVSSIQGKAEAPKAFA